MGDEPEVEKKADEEEDDKVEEEEAQVTHPPTHNHNTK